MEFLLFWGESIKRAFNISKAAIEMLGFLIILVAGLGLWKIAKNRWPQFLQRVEKIPCLGSEASRTAIIFSILFFVYLIAVGPYSVYNEKRLEWSSATNRIARLQSEIEKVRKSKNLQVDVTGKLQDEEGRKKLAETEKELGVAREKIRKLELGRQLDQSDIDALTACLSSAPMKGPVAIRVNLFDEGASDYGYTLENIFKNAGYEVRARLGTITSGYTGETLRVCQQRLPT
jgi:hypothetical protein